MESPLHPWEPTLLLMGNKMGTFRVKITASYPVAPHSLTCFIEQNKNNILHFILAQVLVLPRLACPSSLCPLSASFIHPLSHSAPFVLWIASTDINLYPLHIK